MPVYAYGFLIYPLFYRSGHRTFGSEDPIDQGQVCGGPGGHNSPSGGGNQAAPDHDALRTAFIISQGLEATAGCPYGMAMHSLLGKIHPQVRWFRVPEHV